MRAILLVTSVKKYLRSVFRISKIPSDIYIVAFQQKNFVINVWKDVKYVSDWELVMVINLSKMSKKCRAESSRAVTNKHIKLLINVFEQWLLTFFSNERVHFLGSLETSLIWVYVLCQNYWLPNYWLLYSLSKLLCKDKPMAAVTFHLN